jgi:hypothetical protein
MPTSPTSSTKRSRGAPKGNLNALQHGFYTRRIKKSHLTGVESTDVSGLIEEIALIRVFTRRLIESCTPEADAYELAEILRILCLASSTISRVVRTQCLITATGTSLDDEIAEAIRQVNYELLRNLPPSVPDDASSPHPDTPSNDALQSLTTGEM